MVGEGTCVCKTVVDCLRLGKRITSLRYCRPVHIPSGPFSKKPGVFQKGIVESRGETPAVSRHLALAGDDSRLGGAPAGPASNESMIQSVSTGPFPNDSISLQYNNKNDIYYMEMWNIICIWYQIIRYSSISGIRCRFYWKWIFSVIFQNEYKLKKTGTNLLFRVERQMGMSVSLLSIFLSILSLCVYISIHPSIVCVCASAKVPGGLTWCAVSDTIRL